MSGRLPVLEGFALRRRSSFEPLSEGVLPICGAGEAKRRADRSCA